MANSKWTKKTPTRGINKLAIGLTIWHPLFLNVAMEKQIYNYVLSTLGHKRFHYKSFARRCYRISQHTVLGLMTLRLVRVHHHADKLRPLMENPGDSITGFSTHSVFILQPLPKYWPSRSKIWLGIWDSAIKFEKQFHYHFTNLNRRITSSNENQ